MNTFDSNHIQYGQLYHGPGSRANRPFFRLKMLTMEQFKKVEAAKKFLIEQGIKCVLQTDSVQNQQLQMQNAFTVMQKQQAWALMCRIYIGSVNITVNEDLLRATFLPYGPIKMLSVNIDPATGKHKGFAFLEYETPEAALLAVDQLNGLLLGGKNIKVGRPTNMPQAQAMVDQHFKESKDNARIYVASIHHALQDNDLISVFTPFGNVIDCEMPRDSTSKHKGYAYLVFDKKQSAIDSTAALNLFELGGQKLRVGKAITQSNPDLDEAPMATKKKIRESLNLYIKEEKAGSDVGMVVEGGVKNEGGEVEGEVKKQSGDGVNGNGGEVSGGNGEVCGDGEGVVKRENGVDGVAGENDGGVDDNESNSNNKNNDDNDKNNNDNNNINNNSNVDGLNDSNVNIKDTILTTELATTKHIPALDTPANNNSNMHNINSDNKNAETDIEIDNNLNPDNNNSNRINGDIIVDGEGHSNNGVSIKSGMGNVTNEAPAHDNEIGTGQHTES